ncbi:MAG: PKD domain-containing protein [Maribacter sp.]
MKQLLKNIKLLSMCLLVVSFLGCEDDDEGNLPEVIAGFTFTLNEETATVTFINISEEANAFEWDFGDGETSTLINPIKTYSESGTYTVSLESSNVAGASEVFEDEITIQIADPTAPFDSGLLINGDFENGTEPWIGGGLNVTTEGGNSFNLVDVTVAGNPFDVNLSQVVELTQGTNYTLTFEASASVNRTMLAGIGLNEAPFTNTAPSVDLTTDTQTFTLQLSAADFGGANSRVLFDMGAEVGVVVIDNVSLVEGGDGSDSNGGVGFDSGLLTNGDFESGGEPWIGGGLNVVTDGGNSFNSVDVTTAGNPFDVNLSQVVEITQGANYTLTFEASASVNRTMLAGIGLNEAPFTNTAPSVDLTMDTQTFTLQLSAADFGSANSRVLFDMGAEVGTVIIDNVSLVEGGDGSDTNGGTGGNSLEVCDGGDLVNDFEASDDSIFNNFGGGVGTIIDNADTSVNSSAKVAQYVKNAGEVFGGITIALESNIDLNNGTFSIDVNSQSVRQLLFKLEGLNQELIIPTSGTGWETISYDFTGNAGEVTGITLIMDNGTAGDGSADWTIQFDNIRLCDNEGSGGGTGGGCTDTLVAATALPLDFEGCETFLASQNFGAGLTSDLVANPFKTGINTSDFVLQVDKPAGSDFFAGVQNTFASNFDLTTTDTFKFKIYSTKANVVFRFELALNPQTDPVTGNPAPIFVTIPNANEWTEVEVTFTGLPGGPTAYNQLVIKPDNAQGDPAITIGGTYYIDDIILE